MDGSNLAAPRLVAQPFYDRVAMYSTTVGTGTLTMSGAIIAYQSMAAAGVPNGQGVRYVIVDGPQWEVGFGVAGGAGSTLTRGPQYSSNGNAAINCDGNQAVFLAPTSADWANLQSGWLLDTITGATTLGYVTRTGNEVYGISPIPTYANGIQISGNVVSMLPLTGEVIGGAGSGTAIYWSGMLNASLPLTGSELFVVQQPAGSGGSRTVTALNVMMNIPGYTAATIPLAGTELVPIWQSGGNRNVAASAFMLNIPGYAAAVVPLQGNEMFPISQSGANAHVTYAQLQSQIVTFISDTGIPATMNVGNSVITSGQNGYIEMNNNGILGEIPNMILLGSTTLTIGGSPNPTVAGLMLTGALINNSTANTPAPGDNSTALATTAYVIANGGGSTVGTAPPTSPAPRPGNMWWDSNGAQLYVYTGAQWVIAVNPPTVSGFMPLTGGTFTGTVTYNSNMIQNAGFNMFNGMANLHFWNVNPATLNTYWANGCAGAIGMSGAGLIFYVSPTSTAGATVTYNLAMTITPGSAVGVMGNSGLPIPPTAISGTLYARSLTCAQSLSINQYYDTSGIWRQLPGTGTGGANSGPCGMASTNTAMYFSWTPPGADNAQTNPTTLLTLGPTIAYFPGNISSGTGNIYTSNESFSHYGQNSDTFAWGWLANNGGVFQLDCNVNSVALSWGGDVPITVTINQNPTYYACFRFWIHSGGAQCQADSTSGGYALLTSTWSSDRRTKVNLKPASQDALAKVNQLRVWEADHNPPFFGEVTRHFDHSWIADEVEKICPQAVVYGIKGDEGKNEGIVDDMASLNTQYLVPILWQAVQQLSAKLEALEARMS